MNLYDVVRPECVVTGAQMADKSEALRRVAETARQSPVLKGMEEATLVEGLEKREALGSTGFGEGIAIPHCRLEEVSDFVVGILTVPDGVDFDALDGAPVRLIVFIVAPERETNEHVQLLAGISQVLSQPGAVAEILAEKAAEGARESFLRRARDEVARDYQNRSLFHVFVQEEDDFHEILQVFAGIGSDAAVVAEVQNMQRYLAKMPLFAGFWRDESRATSRIIMAIVDKKLTNETLRRIEQVTGKLNDRTGVLVTIQDIYFSAGMLEA